MPYPAHSPHRLKIGNSILVLCQNLVDDLKPGYQSNKLNQIHLKYPLIVVNCSILVSMRTNQGSASMVRYSVEYSTKPVVARLRQICR